MIFANEFHVCVSMTDLVTWHGDGDGDFSSNRILQSVFAGLGLMVDIRSLYVLYFDETSICEGDVHLYRSRDDESLAALDLYRDRFDQLDIICLYFRVAPSKLGAVASHLRLFFDSAKYQISFEQSSHSQPMRLIIDESAYPKAVPDGWYLQKMIVHS